MRMLLVTPSYSPLLGGLQTVTRRLASGLASRGHDVRVVTQRYPRRLSAVETIDGLLVERWLFLRPELDHLRRYRLDLFLASLFSSPITSLRLERLLRHFSPDVVNFHFPDAQIPFVLQMRRKFQFRLVVSLHGNEVERWFSGAQGTPRGLPHRGRGRLISLLEQADAVVACSHHLLARACELAPSIASKGHVLYNGIDLERFKAKIPYVGPRPYVLAAGRLTYNKGFDLLIESFQRAAGVRDDVDLILVGDGEERARLQALSRALQVEERVLFTGRVEPVELVTLLNGCLFLAVPSRNEAFGIVALEALAAGKPVLATRVGGLGELLSKLTSSNAGENEEAQSSGEASATRTGLDPRSECGNPRVLLVEPTADALAEGLSRWLGTGQDESQSLKIDKRALERLDWNRVVERYESVLIG